MALLRHLGLARAHVVGLSRGGVVAIDFALTSPEALHSLVAAATGVRGFPMQAHEAFTSGVRSAAQASGAASARARWLAGALLAPALEQPVAAIA